MEVWVTNPQMATEGAASLVGAVIGALVAFGSVRIHKKVNSTKKTTAVVDSPSPSPRPPQQQKKKYEVVGVPTNFLDPRNRFVGSLKNFRAHLQFAPEIEAFEKVVGQIDSLVGIYYAVNSTDRKKRSDWDAWALSAQTFINSQIDEILAYNTHETVSPSDIKKREIKMYAVAIKKTVEETVEEILRTIMATPFHS